MDTSVVANPGSGGPAFSADQVGGVFYPHAKLVWGPSGTINELDDIDGKRLPLSLGSFARSTVTGQFTAADTVNGAPNSFGVPKTGGATAGSVVAIQLPPGGADIVATITNGPTNGVNPVHGEISFDSTNGTDGRWIMCRLRPMGQGDFGTGEPAASSFSAGGTSNPLAFRGATYGAKWFRLRNRGALQGSTPVVTLIASTGIHSVVVDESLPEGGQTLGGVTFNNIITVQPNSGVETVIAQTGLAAGSFQLFFGSQVAKYHEIIINVTGVLGAAPSLVATVQKQLSDGTWIDVLATAVISAVGIYKLKIYPGAPTVANQSADDFLPQTFQPRLNVQITGSDTLFLFAIDHHFMT